MTETERDALKERYCALRDGELLREALLGAGDLRPDALEVIAEALNQRFGPYMDIAARDMERAGKLFGRLRQVRGFARLRAPGEPVLGGANIPPYDGILFLATGGLGFIPTSAPPEASFRDFDPAALEGPVAEWLGPQGTTWPEGVPRSAARPLPIPFRARLDPASAWIDLAEIARISRARRELRVHVPQGADAVFRLEEPGQQEALERWAAQVSLPFG